MWNRLQLSTLKYTQEDAEVCEGSHQRFYVQCIISNFCVIHSIKNESLENICGQRCSSAGGAGVFLSMRWDPYSVEPDARTAIHEFNNSVSGVEKIEFLTLNDETPEESTSEEDLRGMSCWQSLP